MDILDKVFVSCGVIMLILCGIMLVKNRITYHNMITIGNAIFSYQNDCVRSGRDVEVDYSDCEPYEVILFRLWDCGYARILPPEKFEIIKPYIE